VPLGSKGKLLQQTDKLGAGLRSQPGLVLGEPVFEVLDLPFGGGEIREFADPLQFADESRASSLELELPEVLLVVFDPEQLGLYLRQQFVPTDLVVQRDEDLALHLQTRARQLEAAGGHQTLDLGQLLQGGLLGPPSGMVLRQEGGRNLIAQQKRRRFGIAIVRAHGQVVTPEQQFTRRFARRGLFGGLYRIE